MLMAALICLVPALVSWFHAMTVPSNSSVSIRTVEWLRDNGARGLVNKVESIYYSLTAPPTGGPGLKALPGQPNAIAAARVASARYARLHYRPRNLTPVIQPALPGEGVWRATFAPSVANPPILVTSFRPDPNYPRLVAGVAWINHNRTSTWLYPGRQEPSLSLPARGPEEVPVRLRDRLVATFNSGFKIKDAKGAFYENGHTVGTLTPGAASVVVYKDGHTDVGAWGTEVTMTPDVVSVRQSLKLLVDNGQLAPNLNANVQSNWGATISGAFYVWRSGLGVTASGDLVYVAGNALSVSTLATLLQKAGAVRAMQLDINVAWISFMWYTPGATPTTPVPKKLVSFQRPVNRYFTPTSRDFFAVYAR